MRRTAFYGVALLKFAMLNLLFVPLSAEDGQHSPTELNGGYYLLHHLADDESNLPLLLMVKHAPKEISQFADDVAKVAKKNVETLDRFHDESPSVRFDENPLPAIEQNVRDSIKGDKQHELLFGTSDRAFVRAFLVSQVEASTYAIHLSRVISEHETSPARAKALRTISNDWGLLRARTNRLLQNY